MEIIANETAPRATEYYRSTYLLSNFVICIHNEA
jgi:hypothetical protein